MSTLEKKGMESEAGLVVIWNKENMSRALRHAPVFTLSEMLRLKKADSLKRMCRTYGIPAYSRMNKAALALALKRHLTTTRVIHGLLHSLDKHEWRFFVKAANVRKLSLETPKSECYGHLLDTGIAGMYHHSNLFHFVVPTEIKKIYKTLESAGLHARKEHCHLLVEYAAAAANLYGAIRIDELVDIFNSQNEPRTDFEEMHYVLSGFADEYYGFFILNEYIVDCCFPGDDVLRLAGEAAKKPRYLPDKRTFLEFADLYYIEDPERLSSLRAYIAGNLSGDPDFAEYLSHEIYRLCRCCSSKQKYVDLLKNHNIRLDRKQFGDFMSLINELCDSIRIWINNGHTQHELRFGCAHACCKTIPLKDSGALRSG